MNDRYLFKAKRKNWEEVPGGYWWVSWNIFSGCPEAVDESTLCQCTGLKDKNGKLIWENDVVRCMDRNSGMKFVAVVEFGNPNGTYDWGYQLRHIRGDKPNLDILIWAEMEEVGVTIEVIGNAVDGEE